LSIIIGEPGREVQQRRLMVHEVTRLVVVDGGVGDGRNGAESWRNKCGWCFRALFEGGEREKEIERERRGGGSVV
jgi:hypothetical protein